MALRRLWSHEEDAMIQDLISKQTTKNWVQIAQEMKKVCPHLSRSSKQIRQRWHNHLNPAINTGPWSDTEEETVFNAHRRVGSRWKEIASLLPGRTDNSVKNYFYSTLRRSLRRLNKYLGFKNSTDKMKTLKPLILNQLIKEGETNEQARILIRTIFEFSRFKPNKKNQNSHEIINRQEKDIFQAAINRVIDYNENYNTIKGKHNFPKNLTQKQNHNSLILNTHKIEVKDMFDLATKGHESHYQINIEQNQEIHNNWEQQSRINRMLPDFQHPESQHDLLCKNQMIQF